MTQEEDKRPQTKTIKGEIERITYNDEETGYCVLRLDVSGYLELVTAVGKLAMPTIGETVELTGEWIHHPKFGVQFSIESAKKIEPTTTEGLEKYLGSGLIKGIGPSLAERIVLKFGAETFKILDDDPERLSEIEGIGEKKLETIKISWIEQRDIRELLIYLQQYGISGTFAVRIYKKYGAESIHILKENPYRLAIDIFRIGFPTADKIAESMGFTKDSPLRIKAGVLYVMTQLVGEGHTYIPIEELSEQTAEILSVPKELAEEGIEAARLAEEIIVEWYTLESGEEECAVYLPAFHYAETNAAKNLITLTETSYNGQYVNPDVTIPWVEEELEIELAEQQKEALRTAISSQVMVITGGPGTGKTTLIKAILKIREERGYKVMLAAPTGRAAKRMTEATTREAKTIHRMLEYTGQTGSFGEFMKDEDSPLECDLLIVDEASMIDQILFHHLLKAIPKKASLILVGDVNQLPSVGSGNVLNDIIKSEICPVVKLDQIYRQAAESSIVVNAHRINNGEMPLLDQNSPDKLNDFYFIEQNDPEKVLEIIKMLVTDRIPKRFGFDPVEDIQVLTPMHKGTVGTLKLNAELQQVLNDGLGTKLLRLGRTLKVGDKVMQIKNNYDKDVYNGDIGTIYRIDPDEAKVIIKMDNGLVSYEYTELEELVHAYAVSIHKSQGSEYPAVIIPLLSQHYVMLQRNLIYTAITRGKKLVIIIGSKRAMAMAIKNDTTKKRWTRLSERLTKRK
ncbi:MAG: ATP-dependent RecD-like DNA helicase [Synergistaceae bacterium]